MKGHQRVPSQDLVSNTDCFGLVASTAHASDKQNPARYALLLFKGAQDAYRVVFLCGCLFFLVPVPAVTTGNNTHYTFGCYAYHALQVVDNCSTHGAAQNKKVRFQQTTNTTLLLYLLGLESHASWAGLEDAVVDERMYAVIVLIEQTPQAWP